MPVVEVKVGRQRGKHKQVEKVTALYVGGGETRRRSW